jgi:hypothetical protein
LLPFGGLTAADFAAVPETAPPGRDVASFMPTPVWQAMSISTLIYNELFE